MRNRRRTQRGASLIEMMIALTILLACLVGFAGAMQSAVTATAVAHRRTEGTLLRTGLLERLAITRREIVDPLAALSGAAPTWVVESCYDVNAVPTGQNPGMTGGAWATATPNPPFCPVQTATGPTAYRRWISATAIPDPAGNPQRVWRINAYVERIDQGCTPATRNASIGCVSADTYLTD